jgi:hypothetical protein
MKNKPCVGSSSASLPRTAPMTAPGTPMTIPPTILPPMRLTASTEPGPTLNLREDLLVDRLHVVVRIVKIFKKNSPPGSREILDTRLYALEGKASSPRPASSEPVLALYQGSIWYFCVAPGVRVRPPAKLPVEREYNSESNSIPA